MCIRDRVYRGEHGVGERVFRAVQHDGATLEVNLVEQLAILQAETGVLVNKLRFHLELDDGHGLLYLDVHFQFLRRQIRVAFEAERHARVALVPVSYTHLDVYKRQLLHWVSQLVFSRSCHARSHHSDCDCLFSSPLAPPIVILRQLSSF